MYCLGLVCLVVVVCDWFLSFLIDCALWFVVTAVLVLFLVFLWMVRACGVCVVTA